MPGLAAQSEFQLQILNLLVPRGCCFVNPSLIGVESPYYLEKNLSQLRSVGTSMVLWIPQQGDGAVMKAFTSQERKLVLK